MENSQKIFGSVALSVLAASAALFPARNAEAIVSVRAPVMVRAPVIVRPPVMMRPMTPMMRPITPPPVLRTAPISSATASMAGRAAPPSLAVAGGMGKGGVGGGGIPLPPAGGKGGMGGEGSGGGKLPPSGSRVSNGAAGVRPQPLPAAATQYYSSAGTSVPYTNPWFPYYVMMSHSSHNVGIPQPLAQNNRGLPVSSGVEVRHFVCEPNSNESGFNYVRRCETRNAARAAFHMQVRLGCQPSDENAQSWLQRCAVQQLRP